jgi:hypothetical protein
MSQVVKAIVATDLGERKVFRDQFSPLFQDVFNVKSSIQEYRLDSIAKQYRIGVTIGAQCWVEENIQNSHCDTLENAIERTKKHVIEAIFGEFRHDLMMVERELYNRDFQKARDHLRILEEKMFGTE